MAQKEVKLDNLMKSALANNLRHFLLYPPHKKPLAHRISVFPLILLSVNLTFGFYTSHFLSILFSPLIYDVIFALNYPNQLSLIHQEFNLSLVIEGIFYRKVYPKHEV